jgi:TonB family protein
MTVLLDATLRASIPVLAALLACRFLRRRPAALRHRVLAVAVVAALAAVPLSVVLPPWGIPLPVASETSVRSTIVVASVSGSSAAVASTPGARGLLERGEPVIVGVWLIGVAIGTGLLVLGAVRLARLRRAAASLTDGRWHRLAVEIAAETGIRRPIMLLSGRASDVLATWGLFRPRVLLPAQALTWNEERAAVALRHELAHVRRCDWAVQLAAEMLRTVFWFNPLCWMLSIRLRQEGEHACDDAVLGAGVPAVTYASHLVEIAKACRRPAPGWLPAMSIARPSTLERRITVMLNTRLSRQAPTWRTTAVVVVALVGILVPTASFTVRAQNAGPRALTGHIYDATGSVLPGVELTLIDEREVGWSAVTDPTGAFDFTPVGAGKYGLVVALPGFRPLRSELTLAAARDWTRNITMQVGALQETITVTAKRPAEVARPAAVAGGPVRVGGNIKAPRKLKDARPVYPAAMREAGLEGVVPMEALIGPDGTVASVRVLSAEVHPAFARAAEDAVRQWVFSPTLLNGVPVEVEMTVSVQFSLED